MGIPLKPLQIENEGVRELYEADLVLIRPDHHVAWRSDDLPLNPRLLLNKITANV